MESAHHAIMSVCRLITLIRAAIASSCSQIISAIGMPSTEWMGTSDQFAKNPIGVFVDPSKMVTARAQGASVEKLHRRACAGEFLPKEPVDIRIPLD